MRRITYQQQPGPAAPQPAPATPVQQGGGLSEQLHAALATGCGVFILLTAAGTMVMMFFTPSLRFAMGVMGIAAMGGLIVAAWLTIVWSRQVAARDWRIDDQERKRRHQAEDDEIRRRQLVAEGLGQGRDRPDDERLDEVAQVILLRHFDGQPITRSACEEEGVCTQAEWNTINAAFKALGWRTGRTLAPGDDLQTALARWTDAVEYVDDRVRVWTRSGTGKIRFVEV